MVLLASLTPPVAYPGANVYLNATFHEALAEAEGAALHIAPELPTGSLVEGPTRVGTSSSYLWTLALAEEWSDADSFAFSVDTVDFLGNEKKEQPLADQDGAELTLTIDPTPPHLAPGIGEGFSAELLGLPDKGTRFTFQFVVAEAHPHAVIDSEAGCEGNCPTVRLGSSVLGTVFREPELDDSSQDYLGFRFDYDVSPDDFATKDSELEASVVWSDKAGNSMEDLVEGTVRFDFQPPWILNCSLLPEFGNVTDVFTYTVTATEVLAAEPGLLVEADTEGLFSDSAQVADDGQTHIWQQAGADVPSQTFTLSATLTDRAGNVSLQADKQAFLCPLSATVDGEPPQVLGGEKAPVFRKKPIRVGARGGLIRGSDRLGHNHTVGNQPVITIGRGQEA